MIDDYITYLIEREHYDEDDAGETAALTFEYDDMADFVIEWLKTGEYSNNLAVKIEGWSAEQLHEKFPTLRPSTIFYVLCELKREPETTRAWIEAGLPIR